MTAGAAQNIPPFLQTGMGLEYGKADLKPKESADFEMSGAVAEAYTVGFCPINSRRNSLDPNGLPDPPTPRERKTGQPER